MIKPLTLTQAAQTCKKSKAALLDAIRSGRLSAVKNDKDVWEINPAELHRVYPYQLENDDKNAYLPHIERIPTPEFFNELLEKEKQERELDRQERDRERKQMQSTIDDLRQRLDSETEERRRLTLLLTHQQEQFSDKSGTVHSKIEKKSENQLWKNVFKNLKGNQI